jgi:hypothetical protein
MTLPSSGQLSLDEIATEFGGAQPDQMNEYYGADPYHGVPSSGQLGIADFYNGSIRTAELTPGRLLRDVSVTSDIDHARYGYAASGKSNYWHFEGLSADVGGMGSTTRSESIISGGTFLGLQAVEYNSSSYSSGNVVKAIELMTTRTSNGGWTTIYIKFGSELNVYTTARANGTFSQQFGSYKPGHPDVNGVYKWIFSNYAAGGTYTYHPSAAWGVSYPGGGSGTTSGAVYDKFVTAYNSSTPIYVLFV